MSELDDHQLLAEFARENSETAFAALVQRHVNLVYSTALRSAGNAHAAEEISQAVFIILARKAPGFSVKIILSGWLYQTTRLTAANFLRGEIRRQKREQEAYMQSALNDPETNAWPQVTWLLDDEVAKLGERDRNAIVLRFFENKSLGEVGVALGASEDAAKMRVNRALEKLRKAFAKRGVTLTVAAIAGAISMNSVQAAPAGLALTLSATANGTITSTTLTTLVKTTMKTMTWIKFKFATGVCVTSLLVGGAVTVAISQTTGNDDWVPQAVAKEAQDTYAALSSYSDSGTVSSESAGSTTTTRFNIRLQRPNLYRIDWTQIGGFYTSKGQVWSDGTGDYFMMGAAGQEDKMQPRKMRDMQMALASATGVSSSAAATIPGTFFGQNWGDALKIAASKRAQLKKEKDETAGGVDCHVFSSTIDPAKLPNGGKLPNNAGQMGTTTTTLWIGKQDHLIHERRTITEGAIINLPPESDANLRTILERRNKPVTPEAITALRNELAQAMKLAQGQGTKFVFTETHEHIVVNQKISTADFAR